MIDTLKDYAEKRLELLKLQATEKSSLGAGNLVFIILVSITLLFFIVLLNIGLGLWIGSLLGNYAYGLLIMAGFYLLLTLILFALRKAVLNSVAGSIIKFMYK